LAVVLPEGADGDSDGADASETGSVETDSFGGQDDPFAPIPVITEA
jgi:hypothetical protein